MPTYLISLCVNVFESKDLRDVAGSIYHTFLIVSAGVKLKRSNYIMCKLKSYLNEKYNVVDIYF